MAKLGELCKIQSGGTPSRANKVFWKNGTIPWVKISDIKGKYLDSTEESISHSGLENSSAKIFPCGTILYTIFATLGEVCILNIQAATNQAIAGIQVNSSILDSDYLYYYLLSLKSTVNHMGRGVAQNNINMKILKNFDIPLPPLTEQHRISSQMNSISNLITKHHAQLGKLDEIVKSCFVEFFVDKGFPETTIGNLVRNKIPTAKGDFTADDLIKYIDISSIDNKSHVMTGYTEYTLKTAPSRAQQHIRKGDIVVSTVRPNLKNVAITDFDSDNLVASSGFCVLRAEKCSPAFLMAVVCSDEFTDAMSRVVTGANYPAIKDIDVKNYAVPLPPVDLQDKFSAIIKQIDRLKQSVQQTLDKLETLQKSLMQQYFG